MMANKFIRAPLWTTPVAALVTAMVVAFIMFVQGGDAAQAADDQPSASVSPKIVGGTEVPNGKYPFMALLIIRTTQAEKDCGGALIDPDSVLTAAHCFNIPGKPQSLQVFVGRTVRSSNQGQVRIGKTVFAHPAFNPKTFAHDAAVIKLSSAVSSGITPINLATSTQNDLESPGRNATVAGWGNTIASAPGAPGPPGGPEIPNRMHEAQVPIVSDSSAKQAYDPRPETQLTRTVTYSPPLMIAAGGNSKDTCQGDSGGPLFARVSGKYTQIGITSFGPGCAYKNYPGAYTEVNNPSIRSFITNAASR